MLKNILPLLTGLLLSSTISAAITPDETDARRIMQATEDRDDGTSTISASKLTTCRYGIKNKKDILNILFEIILEQNKRISKLEEIINSSSIDKSFPDIQDDGPDLHESECCDNNNHHDSKEL